MTATSTSTSHTFDICIDESGDDGLKFSNPGCSQWFIVAGAVIARQNIGAAETMLRSLKREVKWKDRKPLHFRDLKEEGKTKVTQCIAHEGLKLVRGIVILAHKPSIASPEAFNEKNRMYFYLTRMLLERASWLCRDAPYAKKREYGDGRARIVFSHRNDLSYERLEEYLIRLKARETSIHWGSIDHRSVLTLSNGKSAGLQIADSLASAFYCANHHISKHCSDQWVTNLKPVMYCRDGKHRGFGVKIFPPSAEKQIAQGELAPWAKSLFPK